MPFIMSAEQSLEERKRTLGFFSSYEALEEENATNIINAATYLNRLSDSFSSVLGLTSRSGGEALERSQGNLTK